jgi:hypothetical protein
MANDFSSDANCVSLFRMENGAYTTDTINGNTLSASGTPTSDTTHYKEGSASVDLDSSEVDGLYRADGDLSADFPGKSGAGNNVFSFAAWVRFDSDTGTNQTICAKYYATGNKRSYLFFAVLGDDTLNLLIGNGVSTTEQFSITTAGLTTGLWYNVLATYNGPTKAWTLRCYRDSDGNTTSNSGTGTVTFGEQTYNFLIGRCDGSSSNYPLNGQLDEIVIFNDIVSSAEHDQIIAGTYGAAAGNAGIMTTNTGFWGPTYG